jgi:Domain of unknown function (DUF6378)
MTDQIKSAIDWKDTTYNDALKRVNKAQLSINEVGYKFEPITQEELDTIMKDTIEETLEQRGSQYGSFEAQATCVGRIISALDDVACKADRTPDHHEIGSWAYLAVKMARMASNPKHDDNTHDLVGYSKLIDELYKEMNK